MKHLVINRNDSIRIRRWISNDKFRRQAKSSEISNLVKEIENGECLPPEQIPPNVVTMNSTVRIKYIDTNKTVEFQIVYPDCADIRQNRISIFAPIATALLGYKKGDMISWNVPKGTIQLLIDDIIYQPEAAGHYHL